MANRRPWLFPKQILAVLHSNPDSHEFLFDQMKIFFYGEGVELAQIDESKEGTIQW